MKKIILKIFLSELERQCNFARIALEQLNIGIKEMNLELIWYSIQSFLIATANISKIFWPSSKKHKERGEKLRKILGIDDNFLIKSRKFRNHFEHFDERIDEWIGKSRNHNFIDSNIGSINMIQGVDQEDIFRNFDPVKWELIFKGETFDLARIREEIEMIYEKIQMFNKWGNEIIELQIDEKLTEFEKKLLDASLSQLKYKDNPLRFNNFAYSFRELVRNVYERLGPEEKIKKCSWYKKETSNDDCNNRPTRRQRIKYAVQGGLSDEFVKEKLQFDTEKYVEIVDLYDMLSKYTHISEKTFNISQDEGEKFVFQSLGTLIQIFEKIKMLREELRSKYEEIMWLKIHDVVINETFEELDIIATHYFVEDVQVEEIRIVNIDHKNVDLEISGTLEVKQQYGSSSDMKNGMGTTMNVSYPYNIKTRINVSKPLDIVISKEEIFIDNSVW